MWAFRAATYLWSVMPNCLPNTRCMRPLCGLWPYLTCSHSCERLHSLPSRLTPSLSLSLSGLSSDSAECLVSNRLPFNRIDRCQLIAQWNPSDYNDNYAAYDFLTRSLFLSSPARIKRRAVDKCLYTHQHTHTHSWSCVLCARVDPFCKCLCMLQAHSDSFGLLHSVAMRIVV